MSSVDKQPTKIKQLPIEIFRDIFDYFSLEEIITSFFGLDSYIDSIIRSINTASHVVNHDDIRTVVLFDLFSTQIGRLTVEFNPKVNLTSLINLQSLTITFGSAAQFDDICPKYFPVLKILHISSNRVKRTAENDVTSSLNNLFKEILSNGFPQLQICTVISIEAIDLNEAWTGSTALRVLIVNVRTAAVYNRIRSLCPNLRHFKGCFYSPMNPSTGTAFFQLSRKIIGLFFESTNALYGSDYFKKRVLIQIGKIHKWEFEKKFKLDSCSMFDIYNSSTISNNTRLAQYLHNTNRQVIHGRIFPEKKPYCLASFRIEIEIEHEYPFKMPVVSFLDPIYHPAIRKNDKRSCYSVLWDSYKPTTTLVELIKTIINIIDNPDFEHLRCDAELANEYQNNYETFYKKALESTLQYGQPRC